MDDLVERLRRHIVIDRGEMVTIDMGDGPKQVSTGDLVQVRNPDGPEAADRIEKLEAALKRLLETTANNAIYHSTDHAEARTAGYATLSDNRGVTK